MIGYGLAFGEGSQFIGYSYFGLVGLPFEDYAFLFFQVQYKNVNVTYRKNCADKNKSIILEHLCRDLRYYRFWGDRRALQLQRLHPLLNPPGMLIILIMIILIIIDQV